MKYKTQLVDDIMAFFVITACITVLEGVLGMVFMPEVKFGYEAFLSPPLFGILSVIFGLVTRSKKELSIKQVICRRALHLLLIEAAVFLLNYWSGNIFEPVAAVSLAMAVFLVFVTVYAVMWMNDKRSAELFNEKLKKFQEDEETILS